MSLLKSIAGCVLSLTLVFTGCGSSGGGDAPDTVDPGTGEWELVPSDRVAEECKLDPALLQAADEQLQRPWAIVRYGKLCHEYYPEGSDATEEVWSATKTMGALVAGIAAYQTRDLERNGRKTGPFSDTDRVDHWLDSFDFNPDAQVAHVLSMVAHNEDLSPGAREHQYDTVGNIQINRLSDMINTAIAQDSELFGSDLEQFTQRFLYEPLGMNSSAWSDGAPDKVFAYSWHSTIRDMARVGLLILNDGVWNGERLLSSEWIDKMTHPAFEDANTSYAYLTWLAARSNFHFGGIVGNTKFQTPLDGCSPAAIWPEANYPRELSEAVDCNYEEPWDCSQEYDVGVWSANGLGGQLIVGHPGLDIVLVVKNLGSSAFFGSIWAPVVPAVVAMDDNYRGDQAAFCNVYGNNGYAPDMQE